jgi:hypothetical protein
LLSFSGGMYARGEGRTEQMAGMTSKLTRSLVGAAMGAGAVGVILALAGVHSPVRTALVIVFLAVAPTAAIAGLLRSFDPFARIILSVVTTLVLLSIVAVILLSSGLWSPIGELVGVAVITGGCLAIQVPSVRARIAAWAGPRWQALLRHLPDIQQLPGTRTPEPEAEPQSEPQPEPQLQSEPEPQSEAEPEAGPEAEPAKADPAAGTEVTTPLPAIHD